MIEKSKFIWMDGDLLPWEDARVHVLTHTLHYGLGAFEGIRSYATEGGGSAIFRLEEHLHRLSDSCHMMDMRPNYSRQEMRQAIHTLLLENGLEEAYVRPLVFIGEGAMGLNAVDNPVHTMIAAFPWGTYLGDEGLKNGIRVKISSYARLHPNTLLTQGKICGHYVNSILAKREAIACGFQEALLLDTEGYVAEASGENVFVVHRGRLKTPPTSCVLDGITRNSVFRIATDLGFELTEERISREELYVSDEVFITGTAAEITPVREVDGRRIGAGLPGELTQAIQRTYFDAVRGRDARYHDWLDRLALAEAPKSAES